MKLTNLLTVFTLGLALFLYSPAIGQMGGGGMGHGNGDGNHGGSMGPGGSGGHIGGSKHGGMMDGEGWNVKPDTLTQVTVQGTVIIDSTLGMMPMYFLDTDGDGQADYHLNFGPYWYTPDSSNAVRPAAGDEITVTGGSHDNSQLDMPVVIVYELNGEFWREPYAPFWNNMGRYSRKGGHSHGSDDCFSFGMMEDSLETVTVSGSILLDSTFAMNQFYLDEDGDGAPDYFLNFGPPWYKPESGAMRPANGDTVHITGGMMENSDHPVIVVYEINGMTWRDSTGMGSHFGGVWVPGNMSSPRQVHNPFDRSDWMRINPGWEQNWRGQMGRMMAPESLFCQLLELYPENVPNSGNKNHFAGYQVGVFFPDGQTCMGRNGRENHLRFGSSVQFQLHYNDIQTQGFNVDENSITAQYYDDETASWVPVDNAVVDPVENTVTFSTTKVSSYVILSADQATGIEEAGNNAVIDGFSLKQNYPNPFNPTTTIAFSLTNSDHVTLNIYNVLGEFVTSLVNGQMSAGAHEVNFDASSLSSGTYFYELRIGQESKIKKMNLMK